MKPILSICMATLNRGAFLAETLDTIISQLQDRVELVIVDGASTDNTSEVVSAYQLTNSRIRYIRLSAASGVDQDYDIAVSHARGDFCWLMTDDDLLKPGAIARVLHELGGDVELVVVNSEVRTVDFGGLLNPALITLAADYDLVAADADSLLIEAARALSFIGCVVISREFWLARNRAKYYGSLFVHVGVIFQSVTPRTHIISESLITIRYGNAMWTPRGFEIWMFKWPSLIWSFSSVSEKAKQQVCTKEPWRQPRKLWLYRGLGGYGKPEYQRFLSRRPMPRLSRMIAVLITRVPALAANVLSSLYCGVFARHARMNMYDLSRSVNTNAISRTVARLAGF